MEKSLFGFLDFSRRGKLFEFFIFSEFFCYQIDCSMLTDCWAAFPSIDIFDRTIFYVGIFSSISFGIFEMSHKLVGYSIFAKFPAIWVPKELS